MTTYQQTEHVHEISVRVIIIAILLTILLATSNAYLALKIGILTSASIPAAVIAMGILKFFKNASILENNLIQTAASAGEAVAGGIVYVIPALIIIHYWTHFSYLENVIIAALGGCLGVFFSIPIRRVLVTEKSLKFPEAQAIAEVLRLGESKPAMLKQMLFGGLAGAFIEFCQTGLKVLAGSWQTWTLKGRALMGFGVGFSATMIGAGYLIGFNTCVSIFIGAMIGWVFTIPILSELLPTIDTSIPAADLVMQLWSSKISYIGIGAMLFAGLWTIGSLLKPFIISIQMSIKAFKQRTGKHIVRTEYDIPFKFVAASVLILLALIYLFFIQVLPLSEITFSHHEKFVVLVSAIFYILVIGFIFSAITGYFSGMVGVTATPGSAIIITTLLFAALLLKAYLPNLYGSGQHLLIDAEAVIIIIGAIIAGTIAIANDNMQDLKVGHLIGATPWKQQVMLLLGVLVSALVIPPVMELLFNVYGIADVFPREGMDISQTLPAPPAALMAAVTRGVFDGDLPWEMLGTGALITFIFISLNGILSRLKASQFKLSILGVAIGIYLPMASSVPLFFGGSIAWWVNNRLEKQSEKTDIEKMHRKHHGILLACGLIAGSVLMDVLLAIPFSMARNPNVLRIMPAEWMGVASVLAVIVTGSIAYWFYRIVVKPSS